MGIFTLNIPLLSPVEVVVTFATPLVGAQSAQLAMVMLSGCGGTQLCPVTVILLPAVALVAETLNDGFVPLRTVNGPSSFELTTKLLVVLSAQILSSTFALA
jgi:hypothetical protein